MRTSLAAAAEPAKGETLQGYLKKQGRNGVWKTRFFQLDAGKLLYFEKDAVAGVIERSSVVNVVKKEPLLFCIHTSDRQYVLAPTDGDAGGASVTDYWVDGLNRWIRQNKAVAVNKNVLMGVRNRDSRSASLGMGPTPPLGMGPAPPLTLRKGSEASATGGREQSSPPSATKKASIDAGRAEGSPSPSHKSKALAVPQRQSSEKADANAAAAAAGSKGNNAVKSLLRLGSRLRESRDSMDASAKVGSAPSGSGSSSVRNVVDSEKLNDAQMRKANRAKSLEDLSAVGEGGAMYGALARVPLAQRENVVMLQKAFLDFRRLTLKTHLIDVHMRAHDEDALLLPEIRRLEAERRELTAVLAERELAMEQAEDTYYGCGAALASSFKDMLATIKRLGTPLNVVLQRMQELYKEHMESDLSGEPAKVAEVGVLVAKFRSFLPLLEDALVLDKPLTGRKNAMREKLSALADQNRRMREQLAETEDVLAMTTLDCETMREFSEKAVGIGETLTEVQSMSSSFLPWMSAPSSQVFATLSHCASTLEEDTAPLRRFRDPNFVDVLEQLAAQATDGGGGDDAGDFELADDGSLAFVTPDKMVELVVTGRGAAYALDFPKIFVSTFRLCLEPLELLEKLILIYCTTPSDGAHGDARMTEERRLAPCRLRILNLLKKWVAMHKYDFDETRMMPLALDFLNSTLKLTGYERVAENLVHSLQAVSFPLPPTAEPPPPLLPRARRNDGFLTLTDIEPLELARQMCLDDQLVYGMLEARDFLNCAWSRKNDPRAAPTIKAMIAHHNQTAEWITGLVLVADDAIRVQHIRHFIQTAQELLKLNNFNSCIKVLGALSGQAVHRLHSWDRVPREDMKLFGDMKGLIAQNWAGLRELMATCGSPTIPHISPFLGDLTYIDEMRSRSGKNLFNFRKLVLTSQAMERVLGNIDVRYNFVDVPEIRRWIAAQEKNGRLSADEAHARSMQIQPRGAT